MVKPNTFIGHVFQQVCKDGATRYATYWKQRSNT